ncbi:MAG TPA: hypothetical protein PK511_09615 [Chitinophagales bacterium]|nr:terminase small subunit protein [bacterium]HMY95669.1 hypothetical protein [Cyclobacteriaceae bacterium]HNA14596.1 hypothetical protein [Cyclobacteriaceae bacterium]HNI54766.1 hypothetical protein [Chitinophagales bacterium]
MNRGRPSKYSEDVIELLCDKIANSTDGLKKICDSDDRLPGFRTVFTWLANPDYKDFQHKYARAREAQAELLADEIIDISDSSDRDYIQGQDGTLTVNHEYINRSRLRVDARKWKASKLYPKKYGERVEVENTGNMKFVITTKKRETDTLETNSDAD